MFIIFAGEDLGAARFFVNKHVQDRGRGLIVTPKPSRLQ